jgi:hypothetical protein
MQGSVRTKKRVIETSDDEEHTKEGDVKDKQMEEGGVEDEEMEDGDANGDEDDEDYAPENRRGSCKKGKTSDTTTTTVITVTEEGVTSFRELIKKNSGCYSNDGVELEKKATICAGLQQNAILSAIEGDLAQSCDKISSMASALLNKKLIASTMYGDVRLEGFVDNNNKTSPGVRLGDKLGAGLNVFSINKKPESLTAEGFCRTRSPDAKKSMFVMYEIDPENRPFKAHNLTSFGPKKAFGRAVHILASLDIHLYSKPLDGHVLPNKQTKLLCDDKDKKLPSDEKAKVPPKQDVKQTPPKSYGVQLILGEIGINHLVPVSTEEGMIPQLEGMANIITPSLVIKRINDEIKLLTTPIKEGDTLGYNETQANDARRTYFMMHTRNPKKNPIYVGFVYHPLCHFKKLSNDKVELECSFFNKNSKNEVVLAQPKLTVKRDLVSFLVEVFGQTDYMKEKYDKHTQWVKVCNLEDFVKQKTSIAQKAFMILPDNDLFSVAGNGRCTRTETSLSVRNVPPETPLFSLEDEAAKTELAAQNQNLPAFMREGLMVAAQTVRQCATYVRHEYKKVDKILSGEDIDCDKMLLDLDFMLSVLDEDDQDPSCTKLSMLLPFKHQNPSEYPEGRKIQFLTWRILVGYIHCKNSENLNSIVEEYLFIGPDQYLGDYNERFEKKETLLSMNLEVVSFFAAMISLCDKLQTSLIEEINAEIPEKKVKKGPKKIDIERMQTCLNGFTPDMDPVELASSIMTCFGGKTRPFEARYVSEYLNEDEFTKNVHTAYAYFKSPEDTPIATIVGEIKKNEGPTEEMKLGLKTYLKDLIRKTYDKIPQKRSALASDSEAESEDEKSDGPGDESGDEKNDGSGEKSGEDKNDDAGNKDEDGSEEKSNEDGSDDKDGGKND